jgi:hypothetical protein
MLNSRYWSASEQMTLSGRRTANQFQLPSFLRCKLTLCVLRKTFYAVCSSPSVLFIEPACSHLFSARIHRSIILCSFFCIFHSR